MKCIAVMLSLALLAGCGTTSAKLESPVVTVAVKVKEPCIEKAPQRPDYHTGKGQYPGDIVAAVLLAEDFEKADQYGRAWEAAAAGCTRPDDP